jgi:tetratricopeptide (TPR) repeat protein
LSVLYAFFSYTHHDEKLDPELFAAFSTELESRVNAQFVNDKLNIWRDENGLLTGVNWNATIEASLRESKLLIVMLSPKWLGSDYCRKEFTIFREVERELGMETLVVPLLLREVASKQKQLTQEQLRIFENLTARQYKSVLVKEFLKLDEDARDILVESLAEEIAKTLEPLFEAANAVSAPVSAPETVTPVVRVDSFVERLDDLSSMLEGVLASTSSSPESIDGPVGIGFDIPAAQAILPPHNLPLASIGDLFMGRTEMLGSLATRLSGACPVIALHGMGGIGKTRLAAEYAWRHARDYSALLFVSAETPEILDSSLASLAATLNLPQQNEPQDPVKIAAVLAWLAANSNWLLILDNVDDEKAARAVSNLLPKLATGKTLITARYERFPPAVPMLRLGVLEPEPACDFLMARTEAGRRADAEDSGRAAELAKELGYLALGLEQAGAFIAAQRISFERYLAYWRDERARVLDSFDQTASGSNHDKGLAAVWTTSVARLSAQARRLFDRIAFLAPEPIPEFLLDVQAPGAEPLDASAALGELYAYSLAAPAEIEGRYRQPAFVVHRLVQEFARANMDGKRKDEMLRETLSWASEAFDGDPSDVRNWPRLDPLAVHAHTIAETADRAGGAEPCSSLMNQIAQLFLCQARNLEAEPLMRRALEIDERNNGPDHPNVARDLNNLAALLQNANRLDEAEPLMRRALDIVERNLGPDHANVAVLLNNLAQLLQSTNRLSEAEPLMRRALDIDEKSFGPGDSMVAIRLNNLAGLLRDTNRLAEAELLTRRALVIDEKSFGPDHPKVAIGLNNLAALLKDTNRRAEAEPLMRRALDIDEKSLGPDHPNMAIRLNNLARLLQDTGRLAEAEPLMRRALDIDERSLGPDHPNVAIRLNNLAVLLHDTHRVMEAEPLFHRSVKIFAVSLGHDHPTTKSIADNYRVFLRRHGAKEEKTETKVAAAMRGE